MRPVKVLTVGGLYLRPPGVHRLGPGGVGLGASPSTGDPSLARSGPVSAELRPVEGFAARVELPPLSRRRGRPGKGASFPGTARTAPATPEGGLRGRWSFYPPSGYQYIPGRIRPAAVGGSGEAAAPRKLDSGGHGGRLAAPAPGLDGSPQAWVLSSRGSFSSGASPRKLDSGGQGGRLAPPTPGLDGSPQAWLLSSRGLVGQRRPRVESHSGGRGIRPSPPAPWLDGSGTRTRYGLKKGRRASPRVFPGRPVGFGKTQLGSNLHPTQGHLGRPGRAPRPRARRGRLPRPRREVSGGDGPFTPPSGYSIYLDV
ncbi:hypothetical protein ROHU_025838 [Labeo rohita]|uniref:Uncharacterized protein n=1 Tax=Labeo rohita TaxID=84645 RepID=A0A498MJ82_LABRO|nr:hypothetical protein ROHU_025838 [Labeo rohita]